MLNNMCVSILLFIVYWHLQADMKPEHLEAGARDDMSKGSLKVVQVDVAIRVAKRVIL